jgi:hypothetical protein
LAIRVRDRRPCFDLDQDSDLLQRNDKRNLPPRHALPADHFGADLICINESIVFLSITLAGRPRAAQAQEIRC